MFRDRRRSAGKAVRRVSAALGRGGNSRPAVDRETRVLHDLAVRAARDAARVLANARRSGRSTSSGPGKLGPPSIPLRSPTTSATGDAIMIIALTPSLRWGVGAVGLGQRADTTVKGRLWSGSHQVTNVGRGHDCLNRIPPAGRPLPISPPSPLAPKPIRNNTNTVPHELGRGATGRSRAVAERGQSADRSSFGTRLAGLPECTDAQKPSPWRLNETGVGTAVATTHRASIRTPSPGKAAGSLALVFSA